MITAVPAGRTVFSGERIQVRRSDRLLFAGDGVDVIIRGPERIALIGSNGAGKSTLLQVISGQINAGDGAVIARAGCVAYLTQWLDLLDPSRTVAESLAAFAPHMPQAQRMTRLARFLFPGRRAHQSVATLSGGERLRATHIPRMRR